MLKNMSKIRRCINETAAKVMVHTMTTSKHDYCNAIPYGLPESTLKHFTKVQNLSARFISLNMINMNASLQFLNNFTGCLYVNLFTTKF